MEGPSFRRLVGVVVLAWLAVIGFDFLLHASILAPLYAGGGSFLLPPDRAFVLIPLGYLSFLIYVVMLVWLMNRLEIYRWAAGLVFGLKLGALIWSALTLALLSISTASPILMLGWFLGQTVESGIAGLVAGAGFKAAKPGRLAVLVVVFAVGALAIGIVLQNL